MKHFFVLACSLLIAPVTHGAALVIGGWSTNRAGVSSLVEGPFTEEWRAAALAGFPGSTFVGLDALTPAALNPLDVIIVGAPTLSGPPISLSSSEQTALLDFVRSGGGAQIFFDNDSYAGVPASDDAAETYLDPFGIDATGRVPSQSTTTSIALAHPVINGQFGTVTNLFTNFGGWFETVGPATPLAQYDANGQIALAAIAPGALGAGSGAVVILGDADPIVDSGDGGLFGTNDNRIYFMNALAYTPEPSAAMLLLSAGAVCAGLRRRS